MKKVAKFLRKFLPALALLSALIPRTATANTFLTDAWLLQGGNLFGDNITVGSLDAFNLIFFTNGTEKMRLFTSGGLNLGNTTDPGVGNITAVGPTYNFGTVDTGSAVFTLFGSGSTLMLQSGPSQLARFWLQQNGGLSSVWSLNVNGSTSFTYAGTLSFSSSIITGLVTFDTAGSVTAVGPTHVFGTQNVSTSLQVGKGTTSTDDAVIKVRSGNSGTTSPTIQLLRSATVFSNWNYNGTDTFFGYTGTFTLSQCTNSVCTTFTTFLTESSAGLLTNIGHVLLDNTGTASELRLREPSASGSEYSSFKSVAMGANANYSLPPDDGTSGQFLRTDGVGVLTWVTASGSGDVTAVGPGCLIGDCWTNGLATTGSVLLVWEGTTVNGTDFTINVPADPNFSIAWTVPNAITDLTFPSGTDTVVARDSTDTLTGKTLNVESTGNIVTTVEKIWLPAASCANTSAAANWDTTSNTQPSPGCVTGTNTVKGVLSFDDATDEAVQTHIMLPADWTGNIDARIKWYGSALTNAVGWCIQLACAADGEVDDPAFPAQSAANCVSDTAKGTANQSNDVTITNITPGTGGGVCAAGELMHVRWSRDANGSAVTDSFVGDANGIGVELTLRRAQ